MWKDGEILTAPREIGSTGGVGKSKPFYTQEKQNEKFPHSVFHIFTKSGGIVERIQGDYLLIPDIDIGGNILDDLLDFRVLLDHLFHPVDGVEDGGVVPALELLANLF